MINVGDVVKYTAVSRHGKIVSMTTKTGHVIDIQENVVVVKTGKKTINVPIGKLRSVEERSELTEFVEAIVEANRNK